MLLSQFAHVPLLRVL